MGLASVYPCKEGSAVLAACLAHGDRPQRSRFQSLHRIGVGVARRWHAQCASAPTSSQSSKRRIESHSLDTQEGTGPSAASKCLAAASIDVAPSRVHAGLDSASRPDRDASASRPRGAKHVSGTALASRARLARRGPVCRFGRSWPPRTDRRRQVQARTPWREPSAPRVNRSTAWGSATRLRICRIARAGVCSGVRHGVGGRIHRGIRVIVSAPTRIARLGSGCLACLARRVLARFGDPIVCASTPATRGSVIGGGTLRAVAGAAPLKNEAKRKRASRERRPTGISKTIHGFTFASRVGGVGRRRFDHFHVRSRRGRRRAKLSAFAPPGVGGGDKLASASSSLPTSTPSSTTPASASLQRASTTASCRRTGRRIRCLPRVTVVGCDQALLVRKERASARRVTCPRWAPRQIHRGSTESPVDRTRARDRAPASTGGTSSEPDPSNRP